ncbi:MAG: hypothetical protein RBU23_07780 [Candidatus Auribacterota bacterium]|jgi:hypothetical protein|nr:hypothetical protein [Candidatus Auribacterota bacterium]
MSLMIFKIFLLCGLLIIEPSFARAEDYYTDYESGYDSETPVEDYSSTSGQSSYDNPYTEPDTAGTGDMPTYQSPAMESPITREIHSGIEKNPYNYSTQTTDHTGRSGTIYQGTDEFQNDRLFSGQQYTPMSGERIYYNQAGQQMGRSETDGNIRRFYNNAGGYTGYAETDATRTQYYDSRGATSGYSFQEGNITRHYSQNGDYIGYSIDQGNIILQFDNKTGYKPRTINLDQ